MNASIAAGGASKRTSDTVREAGSLVEAGLSESGIEAKLQRARGVASSHVMSAENLVAKLNFTLEHTMLESNTQGRMWIDNILLRVAAMVRGGNSKRLIIEPLLAHEELRGGSCDGRTDYLLCLADERRAGSIVRHGEDLQRTLRRGGVHGMFLAAVEGPVANLAVHVPEAIAKMRTCARRMEWRHMRGAITNGRAWMFLFLKLDEGSAGGQYWTSWRMQVTIVNEFGTAVHVTCESVEKIVAILFDWVMHAAEELEQDEWFAIC
ncbi:hypothetical protein C8Q77DRAFT_932052 [Trametes polyzona]|nr:hypothetical protein C8Q77DRAFT_932052 [Trametes polyzona]